MEKRQLKAGDKTVLYEKLGILDESDLKVYQKKFGVKADQMDDEEALSATLADKTIIGKKKGKSRYHRAR